MSTVQRGRRIRYDNISVGNALTTPEKVISGQTVTYNEIYGGGYMTSTSTGDVWQNNIKVGTSVSDEVSPGVMQENLVVVGTSDIQQENVKVGG
jgi:hypothetical protein